MTGVLGMHLPDRSSPFMYKFAIAFSLAVLSGAAPPRMIAQAPATKTEAEKKPDVADTKKPETPPEKPFADVIKDAQVTKGLFTFYQNEEKVFLEIQPDQFDKLYMFSLTCESGLG